MNPNYAYQLYQAQRVTSSHRDPGRRRSARTPGRGRLARQPGLAPGPDGRAAGQPRISTAFTLVGLIVTITRRSPGRSWSRRLAWYFAPNRSANE